MAISSRRTNERFAEQFTYEPIAPDGTWQAPWPPEVWLVKWRLQVLGYRRGIGARERGIVEEAARGLYVQRYGHEPPRRGRRRNPGTIVFEHARVHVIDEAAAQLYGPPPQHKKEHP